jgi:threonyl-tRNA synthetase
VEKIRLRFPDGQAREYDKGITPRDVAADISGRLAREALAAIHNERYLQLSSRIEDDGEFRLLTWSDSEGKDVYRHSSAHLMAQAIKRLWPQAQLGIGPPIEDGFYYDIDLDHKITPEDFPRIEAEMNKIINSDYPIEYAHLEREEAVKFFTESGEMLKLDLINRIEEDITTYSQAEFTDLCRGPHLDSTKAIKPYFKLLSVAGAYWMGDENNKMLQRLYATSFLKKKELDEYLERLEEAKKRDHRKLGKELKLFSIDEKIGAGLVLWHPRGGRIRNEIENFWKQEHLNNGYELIYTPHVARHDLWQTSGHADFYSDNMYQPMAVEEVSYQLKPMNCPFHVEIYKSDLKSYRDLPLRFAELGTVYRYERSGVLHGLMRVRGFTQDDAHIFCLPTQAKAEIKGVLEFNAKLLGAFGFSDFKVFLSTRPEKSVGSDENWAIAENALRESLEELHMDYTIDPGEGVFYGPKIDIKIKDSIGRLWQCSTVQFDFNLPERFAIGYIGEDGQEHRPIMIHRALFGSLERFFGILIEHYAGQFPLWLAPLQAIVLPLTDRHHQFANHVANQLRAAGFRAEVDKRNEKVGYKIREAELQKIPYMLVVGDKEVAAASVSVRHKVDGDLGSMSLTDLQQRLAEDTETRTK